MLEFRKKLSGYKDAILKKLTLSPEQRKELVERLKMFKRKTIDQVSPAGDSIEEINLRSQIAGALFQGDMVLSKFVPPLLRFLQGQHESIPLDAEISAQDSIRVFMEDGCWSFVGRLGGIQNLSLGEGCDSVCFNKSSF
ncbi:hypothetical protein COOONC_27044 [Cooperia oncophora]